MIHLQDSPERLEPEIENRIFSHRLHQPSGPYRVLRSLPQRYGRAADGTAGVGGSAFELSLPIDGSEVHLQLEPIDIASPGLTLSFTDDPNREVPAPHNCMFAGASGDTWAVMSVCDELNGVVDHLGKSFEVEAVDSLSARTRRDVEESSRYIITRIEKRLSENAALLPIAPRQAKDEEDEEEDVEARESDEEALPRRWKRAAADKYTIELAVYVDRALYRYVKKRYPSLNQDQRTLDIVMTIVNAVHRLYSDKSLGKYKIAMLVKKVEVLPTGKPKAADGDIYSYLKNFCVWQSSQNPKTGEKKWDHALLLSGMDLWNEQRDQNSTVGLAYVGGMCSSTVSCTISEGTSFAAAYIAAHEIGHNLDMRHDGGSDAWMCKGKQFLMSSVMSSGATTWSSCSKEALGKFLNSGSGRCLTSTKKLDDPRKGHGGKLPGRRFGASEQCHYMYGAGWDFFSSTESPFNNVCKEIWCKKGFKLRTPSASALEGTPCGPLKICKRGKCKRVAPLDKDGKKKLKEKKKKKKKKEKKEEKKDSKKIVKKSKNKGNKKKKDKSKNKKTNVDELDLTKKKGIVKKKKETKEKKKKNNNKKLTVNLGDQTTVRTKEKISTKSKKPRKSWRVNTPTHIVLKERVGFVEGKGWKIKVLRIRKTKKMIEAEGGSGEGEKKKKTRVKTCKGRDRKKCKRFRKKRKRTNKNLVNTILQSSSTTDTRCQLQKVKKVKGKGWWVRLPLDCLLQGSGIEKNGG
ncbi:A disintegrin and metalloproteinase with thrombospondin motifs adt-2 isoform X2 [Penaeus vannamei]|uniref:A disintegrin and metalloproteinase with thrombospondin motifs adt-2 isoform X2 n=1 Tax=Penaeus vannamei TaxID=6689 RepID=UPI00387F9E52